MLGEIIIVETDDGVYIARLLKLTENGRIFKTIGFAHDLDEAIRNKDYFVRESIHNARTNPRT